MAQHRADDPKKGPLKGPPSLLEDEVEIDFPPPESSSSDVASIDKLLAMTDDAWSVDDDMRALKVASDDSASAIEPLREHPPEVILPTAFELAPNAPTGPSIPPPPGASKPPPLPLRASQAPGRKGPPPIPGSIPPPSLPPPLPRKSEAPGRARRSISPDVPPRPPSGADGSGPRRSMATPQDTSAAGLVELLHARIARLSEPSADTKVVDKVGLARAHIEMAIACEAQLGDDGRAIAHAEAALRIDARLAAAHALLRRKRHGRAAIPAMLEHLEHELTASTEEVATVELLVEKARLLDAAGDDPARVRETWEKALSRAPQHAAALKGLEADLVFRAYGPPGGPRPGGAEATEAFDALARHLGRMAEAYEGDPRLSAWIHVERAQILELRLKRVDEARGALERAVELDPSVGPVRNACVRHVSAHSDAGALAALLEEEARIETDPHRAARLELDAASIASELLHDPARAIDLLLRAARRAPTSSAVDRKVLDELVRLHEEQTQWPEAARARRARLRFITEPKTLAYELRMLARIGERTDELESAIGDVQRARHVDPEDATLLDMLDRLLAAVQRDEQRVDLWLGEAKRLEDGTRRARAYARAAQIAETALLRPADAIQHLRAAWVAAPGDAEVLDALARLMTPAPSEELDREARALVDLYAQAASATRDVGRRVAYLEKAAVLWEEVIGDGRRAARAYEEILQLEPDRRGAVIGLGRTAARVGDDRALSRALLDEARLAGDGVDVLTLRARAAAALARVDPDRALVLVEEVLEQDTAHPTARALETRLHEEAGRWERACQSLRARIDHGTSDKEKLSLWLALAQIQDLHLRNPREALASLQAARKLDPSHPVPPAEVLRMLEASGDAVTLRDALEALAKDAARPEDGLLFLIRAAEIDELRLQDDARAALTYARAMAVAEDEEIVAERLERVLARRAAKLRGEGGGFGFDELLALQQQRVERASLPAAQRHLQFDVAQLLVETGRETSTAIGLLESVLLEDDGHVPSLRLLELITRRGGDWAALGQALSRQGDTLRDRRARLGALWALAGLEEWRLPVGDAAPTYARILDIDPTEPSALEAIVRRELPHTRRGEPRARKAVIGALRSLFALASENGTRLAIQLRLALLLEESASDAGEATAASLLREALDRYRACLHLDDLSVTAATGLARTATRLRDTEGAIAASVSLAELAAHPKARAQYLQNAAELLLGATSDERVGSGVDRRARACLLLERALDADPDSVPIAARLAQVRKEDGAAERLVEPFRSAIGRAHAVDAVVMLGGEIARVARDDLGDLPLGIEALRRVRGVAPQHVPSLLMLGELCVAQRSWPEAVDALESVVSLGREPAPRMTALFTLANLYEHVLARPDDAERSIRLALGIEPDNAKALRGLLRHITTVRTPGDAELSTKERAEVADLLSRLAGVERDPTQRCELLLELAEMRSRLGDKAGVEQALIEAVAQTPANKKAFARLTALFRKPGPSAARDHAGYATALGKVVARGRDLGRVDAKWLATLGELEIESLNRVRDGIAHLQQAVQLEPTLHETRLELARAYARSGAPEDTSRQLFTLFTVPQAAPGETPPPTPLMTLKEPTAALVLFEQALGAERRNEEALVVSELRAISGDLDEGRLTWLRQRRLGPIEPHHAQLDRPALVTHVLPPEGRHVLLEVAAAVSGIESKILRADLTEIGISPRDRIGARSGHPTRALLDRLCKVLGLSDVELVVAPTVTRTRVLAQDTLWVVVPRTLCDLPEPSQLASLGRTLTRISLGVPWLEELPPPHIEALLIACARQAVHGYGADELDVLSSKLVAQYEPNVARALTRKHKKLLEELTPHIGAPQGRPVPIDGFIHALARAELRAAGILTGDLLATLDDIRGMDAILFHATERPGVTALGAVLDHQYAGDVCRYALSAEAVAMRRRIGTTWTT